MSPRSHSQYQELLELHISGASLAPDDRFDLFDHIETCDQCRLMLEAEERLTARMKAVPKMVAPSDLRSRILSQAIRDHAERTTTPSEDPHVADLLTAPPQANAAPAPVGRNTSGGNDELPFFPAIAAPRPGRFRRAWRKASPAFATSFLVVASLGALYTGQFQGIPLASQAQQLVWSVVDSALGREELSGESQTAVASVGPASISAETEEVTVSPVAADYQAARPAPLPGTDEIAGLIHDARTWLASLDYTVTALARATEENIPAPAEQSAPQIAALVLKPTDFENDPGGFRQSELAAALEAVARSQPGGRLASQDQFAMDGQRYRLYTLELPPGSTTRLVKNLSPYQSVADGLVVNALSSQDQLPHAPQNAIRFFSGNQALLKNALEAIQPVAATGRNERLRVILVE